MIGFDAPVKGWAFWTQAMKASSDIPYARACTSFESMSPSGSPANGPQFEGSVTAFA